MPIAMIAIDHFRHGDQEFAPTDRLSVEPIQAAALQYQRKARFATDQDIERTVIEPEPEPPAPVVAKTAPKRTRARRQSKRRDMAATHTS